LVEESSASISILLHQGDDFIVGGGRAARTLDHKSDVFVLVLLVVVSNVFGFLSIRRLQYSIVADPKLQPEKVKCARFVEAMENIKCVVVGDGTVEETCMLFSYADPDFKIIEMDYLPTIFDHSVVTVNVNGQPLSVGL
jgi:hypothetical protein